MSIRVVEREITVGEETVGVRRQTDRVKIRWTCGAECIFTPDDLRQVIACAELLSQHGVWFHHADLYGNPVEVRIQSGELHVFDDPNTRVPWMDFRTMLVKALA